MKNITEDILKLIILEKNKIVRNCLYDILINSVVEENKICGRLKITSSKFRKLLSRCNVVTLYFLKETGENVYTLLPSYVDNFFEICKNCKMVKRKEENMLEIDCKLEDKCINRRTLIFRELHSLLRKHGYERRKIEMLDNRLKIVKEDKKIKDIFEWTTFDFIFFIRRCYEEYFEYFSCPKKRYLIMCIKKIRDLLSSKIGDKRIVNSRIKKYIRDSFVKCSNESKLVAWEVLTSNYALNVLVNSEFPEFCEKEKIFCSYQKKGECSLSKLGNKCTSFLIEKMKKKYN